MTTAHRPARGGAGRARASSPDPRPLLLARLEHRHRAAPPGERLALHLVPAGSGTRTGLCGARVALRPPASVEPDRLCADCLALRDAVEPRAIRYRRG